MSLVRSQSNAIVTGASTQLVGVNGRRKSIIISAPKTSSIWISFVGPAAVGVGIQLHPGQWPLVLTCHDALGALTTEISAISTGGAENIGVLDISTDMTERGLVQAHVEGRWK